MAFLVGVFVNAILVSIPIGATLGVLFAIRPFEGERSDFLRSSGLVTQTFCDEFHTFLQNNDGQSYTCKSISGRASVASMRMSTSSFLAGAWPSRSMDGRCFSD